MSELNRVTVFPNLDRWNKRAAKGNNGPRGGFRIFSRGGLTGTRAPVEYLKLGKLGSKTSKILLPAVASIHSIHLSKGAGGRPLKTAPEWITRDSLKWLKNRHLNWERGHP